MMKAAYTFLCMILLSMPTYAQRADTVIHHHFKEYMPAQELIKFNERQNLINRRGLFTLTGWAGANVIYGAIAAPLTHGEERYFHATNAIWGAVNLLIAAPGVAATYSKKRNNDITFGKTVLQQHGQEKLYLLNGALDFAYVGAGAAMWGFSDRIAKQGTREAVSGIGKGVLMQGAFLLLFDWSMYIVHSQHAYRKLNHYTSGLVYTGTGVSYSLAF
ncbi:MAG: hypothetical protein JST83_03395 [Bacteroidetes bacterium]|nr:hypothetical protein [Bacteroidota bacterium]